MTSDADERESDGRTSDTLEPLVRPLGYVEPDPVIRRIGDRELYLGNKFAADPTCHTQEFDFVLSATDESYPLTTHHRSLMDGTGNE